MTNANQKNQVVAAAVTGAIVGASVAVAGAVAMKDKKNRDTVKQVLTNVKSQAADYIESAKAKMKSA